MLGLTLVFIYSIAQSAKMFAHVVKFRSIKDAVSRDLDPGSSCGTPGRTGALIILREITYRSCWIIPKHVTMQLNSVVVSVDDCSSRCT